MKKTCTKCGEEKYLEDFPKSKSYKSGYLAKCKSCVNSHNKAYRDSNPDWLKENRKTNYLKNRESILEQKAKYQKSHRLEKSVYDKEYRELNKDKIRKYKADWEKANKDNPTYKIKRNLRRRLNHSLNGSLKAENTFALLGCTIEEFKLHLESQFLEGMSWSNYGRDGWHIDHIIPCFTFDLSVEEEQRKCFHYTNQRPLWAKDNLSRPRQTWKTSKC